MLGYISLSNVILETLTKDDMIDLNRHGNNWLSFFTVPHALFIR